MDEIIIKNLKTYFDKYRSGTSLSSLKSRITEELVQLVSLQHICLQNDSFLVCFSPFCLPKEGQIYFFNKTNSLSSVKTSIEYFPSLNYARNFYNNYYKNIGANGESYGACAIENETEELLDQFFFYSISKDYISIQGVYINSKSPINLFLFKDTKVFQNTKYLYYVPDLNLSIIIDSSVSVKDIKFTEEKVWNSMKASRNRQFLKEYQLQHTSLGKSGQTFQIFKEDWPEIINCLKYTNMFIYIFTNPSHSITDLSHNHKEINIKPYERLPVSESEVMFVYTIESISLEETLLPLELYYLHYLDEIFLIVPDTHTNQHYLFDSTSLKIENSINAQVIYLFNNFENRFDFFSRYNSFPKFEISTQGQKVIASGQYCSISVNSSRDLYKRRFTNMAKFKTDDKIKDYTLKPRRKNQQNLFFIFLLFLILVLVVVFRKT